MLIKNFEVENKNDLKLSVAKYRNDKIKYGKKMTKKKELIDRKKYDSS